MYLYISQRSIAYTIAWSNSFGAISVYHVIMYLRPVYSKFCCAYVLAFYFYLRWILRLVRGATLTALETAGFCLFTERENTGNEGVGIPRLPLQNLPYCWLWEQLPKVSSKWFSIQLLSNLLWQVLGWGQSSAWNWTNTKKIISHRLLTICHLLICNLSHFIFFSYIGKKPPTLASRFL